MMTETITNFIHPSIYLSAYMSVIYIFILYCHAGIREIEFLNQYSMLLPIEKIVWVNGVAMKQWDIEAITIVCGMIQL